MKRFLLLSLGLAIAAGAFYALVGGSHDEPLDDIDPASRARLERVLAEGAGEEEAAR